MKITIPRGSSRVGIPDGRAQMLRGRVAGLEERHKKHNNININSHHSDVQLHTQCGDSQLAKKGADAKQTAKAQWAGKEKEVQRLGWDRVQAPLALHGDRVTREQKVQDELPQAIQISKHYRYRSEPGTIVLEWLTASPTAHALF